MRKTMRSSAALIMIGALALTSCSSGDDGEATELDRIEIMSPYYSAAPPEEGNPIGEALNELVGVGVDVRWVPNADYATSVTTTLAGDDIPEAMVITSKDQAFVQTAQAGGFWDLTDYINEEDYPNLAAANPDITQAASINGRIYGIYRARDLVRQSVTVRADWLENLGLEMPTTPEELTELARAFTEDDPDGNGIDDTTGVLWATWGSIGQGNSMDAVQTWFGAGNVWKDVDGEIEPSWTQPEWKESLDWIKDLYDKGYMNQDFATFTEDDWETAFINGKGGIIIDNSSRSTEIAKIIKETEPDDYGKYIALGGQLEGPHGMFAFPTAGYAGIIAVSKASVRTEEELAAVLTVLDKISTPEAQRILSNGVEGLNYTVEDGFAVYDPEQQAITDIAQQAYAQLGLTEGAGGQYVNKPMNEWEAEILEIKQSFPDTYLPDAVFNAASGLIAPTYVTNQATLDQIINDARIQYIAGQIDEDGLDAAVQRWRDSGGDAATAELNELKNEEQ